NAKHQTYPVGPFTAPPERIVTSLKPLSFRRIYVIPRHQAFLARCFLTCQTSTIATTITATTAAAPRPTTRATSSYEFPATKPSVTNKDPQIMPPLKFQNAKRR